MLALRGKQVTLGSCVLLLKRPVESLAALEPAEAVDLVVVAGEFERRVSDAFGAERFNYVAAMMKDPFVHFHAFPRYSEPSDFGGVSWTDVDWPKAINIRNVETSAELLDSIKDKL